MMNVNTLKWLGTAVLILGTAVNGMGYWPWGPLLLALGGVIWGIAAIITRDRALLVTNAVMSSVGIVAIAWSLWGPLVDQPLAGSVKADSYYEVDK
jgi:hypothetical protein